MRAMIAVTMFMFAILLSTCSPNENINFLNELNLSPVTDGVFELERKFIIQIDSETIIIPKGFQSDFASIPRVFWPVQSPYDYKNIAPAILHDYQYTCPNNLSRSKIDSIFYSALIDNRVNPVVAYAFWLAVRVGGDSHFNKDNHCAIADKEYNQKISH